MRRMNRRHTRLVSTALVALSLVAASCGSDDEESDTTSAPTSAAPVATSATTAAPTGSSAPNDTSSSSDTRGSATTGGGNTTATTKPSANQQADYDAAFDKLVAAAQEEGSLTIYSSIAESSLNAMAERFTELYDIDVEPLRSTDAETIPRLETEFSTGTHGADLATMAALGWVQQQEEAGNWLPATASPSVAGLGAYDAEQYVHDDVLVETGAAVLTFAWNTDLLPDGLSGYDDIVGNEELTGGKLGVIDPSAGGPAVVDFYAWVTENFGEDYIPQLAEMEPRLYPSALPIGEALTSGEIAGAIYAAPVQLIPAQANGAPVEFGIDEAGAWGARYYSMIPKTAENPNAAALFIEFYLSDEGQALAHAGAGMVIPGVEGALITNDKVRTMDLEVMAADNVAEFNGYFDSLFK